MFFMVFFKQGVLYSKKTDQPYQMPKPNFEEKLGEKTLKFFADRKISPQTLARNRIAQELMFCSATKRMDISMAFPYIRDGEIVNIKYRGPYKSFRQVIGRLAHHDGARS